jgi:oligopeptide transport system ATP-binding protein
MNEEKKVLLSLRNVEVKFNVRARVLTAIRNVSLDIYENQTIAIVGESGSGKSVLTKTFTGMLEENGKITNGEIWFEGRDLSKIKLNSDWQKIRGAKIATIFQDPMTSLNPIRSIGSQIVEVIKLHQNKSAEEAKVIAIDLMKKVGIVNAEKRFSDYPFQYSGGMRQRIVIAIALACRPKILICDEPTTALDVTIQAQIIQLIKDLQVEYGFTTIYITHDLGVVASVADTVAVMYAGQIVEIGSAEEIFFDPRHPYTWALLSSMPQLSEKGTELYTIHGTPPSLYNTVVGDAFAPRNPYAMKIDFVEEPPFFDVSPTHKAKTWLLDPRAPKVEPPLVIQNLHSKLQRKAEVNNHE